MLAFLFILSIGFAFETFGNYGQCNIREKDGSINNSSLSLRWNKENSAVISFSDNTTSYSVYFLIQNANCSKLLEQQQIQEETVQQTNSTQQQTQTVSTTTSSSSLSSTIVFSKQQQNSLNLNNNNLKTQQKTLATLDSPWICALAFLVFMAVLGK